MLGAEWFIGSGSSCAVCRAIEASDSNRVECVANLDDCVIQSVRAGQIIGLGEGPNATLSEVGTGQTGGVTRHYL